MKAIVGGGVRALDGLLDVRAMQAASAEFKLSYGMPASTSTRIQRALTLRRHSRRTSHD